MGNCLAAEVLQEMADLLELKGDRAELVRSYRRAVLLLQSTPREETGSGIDMPGLLSQLDPEPAAQLKRLWEGQSLEGLEELRLQVPPGLQDCLRLTGVSASMVSRLQQSLGVNGLEELEQAVRRGKVDEAPELGPAVAHAVREALGEWRTRGKRYSLGCLLYLAHCLLEDLSLVEEVEQASLSGGLRRKAETPADIDLLVATTRPQSVQREFMRFAPVQRVLEQTPERLVVQTTLGCEADLWLVPPREFVSSLVCGTGSRGHWRGLQERAWHLGLELGPEGLGAPGQDREDLSGEEDLYRRLQLPCIPPQLREDRGELEAAAAGLLPRLLEMDQVRGDLHVHSNWSDGIDSVAELAEAARNQGYSYLAITDHVSSACGGMGAPELEAQIIHINALDDFLPGLRLLAGAEVDILPDGGLDGPPELLQELDVVVAAVHSHFHLDREAMTRRVVAALSNPRVQVLAHPTGRLLGQRTAYPLDLERVLEAAARAGKALEINGSPTRLDLDSVGASRARKRGVQLVLGTDAHSGYELGDMRYGVEIARRAWLAPDDIVNCRSTEECCRWLRGWEKD